MTDNSRAELVLCFGEALWDVFPDDIHPGGAPLNVAYHLAKLGYRSAPVTAVGNDALGLRLLRRMREWGLETNFVTRTDHRLTGLVKVTLKPGGHAIYEIQEGAAWDWVELDAGQYESAAGAAAIVFGTLALRTNRNRNQLLNLISRCGSALKVYDVNLRPPYTRNELVWEIAKSADVIKLNLEELISLLPATKRSHEAEPMARHFARITNCENICVTAGAAGAGLLFGEVWHWESAREVAVKDSVGAGDAFLAGLVNGLLSQSPPQSALENACRLGELVAARTGATPTYEIANIQAAPTSSPSAGMIVPANAEV